MGKNDTVISPQELVLRAGARGCPLLFDVRRAEVYDAAPNVPPTARRRDHAAMARGFAVYDTLPGRSRPSRHGRHTEGAPHGATGYDNGKGR